MFKPSLGRLGLFLVSLLGLMSLFSASALASGPPIVTVSAATNKSLNTANLNGTVDKNGASSASVKFEYGKTKLYGKSVSVSPVSTAGAVPVSLFASGLEPLSTYHFRVSATNSFGTTVSEDMTFEMLLSWKVNGKSASEYSEPTLQSKFGNEPVTIERTIGANVYKLSCTAYVGGNLAVLNKEYNLPFRNCKAYANGVEQKACVAPFEKVVHLNAFAATTKPEFIELGELCPIGEFVPISGGFAINAMSEQVEQKFTLTNPNSDGWAITYGPVEWQLTGALIGLKYGVS